MKIAVVGSRGFDGAEKLCEILDLYIDQITDLITGGAKGADRMAEEWAKAHNIPVTLYLPQPKYGKGQFSQRNKEIVDNCDYVIAFWDEKSKGTKHVMDLCQKRNKRLLMILLPYLY
jgi:hypothetical protein